MVHSRSSPLVLLALLISSCSSSTAEVTVQLRSGASSASIAKVEVSAPGEDPETTTLSGKMSPWTGSMDALADAADTQLYAGQATSVTLADGKKTLVFITLRQRGLELALSKPHGFLATS